MTAPHEPIVARYPGGGEKQAYVRSLFDRSAPHYDRISGFGFLWTGGFYRRRALRRAGLRPGMNVVDVACGTGAVTRACLDVLRGDGRVIGVDPSAGMLQVAQRRVGGAEFRAGHAEALPVADASADFLAMGYALRHVAELERAFGELTRLATGSQDAREMMRYFWETIDACVPPDVILAALKAVGFAEVRRTTEIGVFSAYTAVDPG
jgi:demethylmenaquinone methyltransferase/2-methoxy-6-polyprenyl-1,4-benzoquinol methylase